MALSEALPTPLDPATGNIWGSPLVNNISSLSNQIDTHTANIAALQSGVPTAPPVRTVTGDITLALTDTGGTVFVNSAVTRNITVPADAAVAFLIGAWVRITNIGTASANIIDQAAGPVAFTLVQNETAVLVKQAANAWFRVV